MDKNIYIDRGDLVNFFQKTNEIKGFKIKMRLIPRFGIHGDRVVMQDEFGSTAERYVSIITIPEIKNLIYSMIGELSENNRDKYVDSILKEASKKMVYGQ